VPAAGDGSSAVIWPCHESCHILMASARATPTAPRVALLACFGITAALHTATVLLNTLLPLHVTALGGSKTQVGLLFSVTTLVGMVLRPVVGGWVDRHGARRLIGSGALLFFATSLAFHTAGT